MERIALDDVRDLIVVGQPLKFAVLDPLGQLLVNQGQIVGSERQFEQLVDRWAWVERPKVMEVRRERAGAASIGQTVASAS